MPYACPICAVDPTSHSLVILPQSCFYTCPAKATKYTDTEGIVNHYDGVLGQHSPKPWTWIFDSAGFELRHMMEVTTATRLARLINDKYSANLTKIIVVNPTWHIRITYMMVKPFLSTALQSKIEFHSS